MKRTSLLGSMAAPTFLFFAMFSCVGEEANVQGRGADGGDLDATTSDAQGGGDANADAAGGGDTGNTADAADAGDGAVPPHVPILGSYLKASNTRASAGFGNSIAISADGNTIAVGSPQETSVATGVNSVSPGPGDTSASQAGAVYVYTKSVAGTWSQQAYIKASNTTAPAFLNFGCSVSLSSDGYRLAVGAKGEDSTQLNSGAAYMFHRSGSNWAQSGPPLKASNIMASAEVGTSVALSGDGNTLAVGAMAESSADVGVTTGAGGASNGSFTFAGAAYIYTYVGGNWGKTHYVKPSNTQAGGRFGWSVALSGSGSVLAIGSSGEASNATGVSTSSSNTSAPFAGAVYLFEKDGGGAWAQAAYVKASNTRQDARFGQSVSLSADGATLAVGSHFESSGATGVNNTNPGPGDTTASQSGAAYVFTKSGATWAQSAYIKASNTRTQATFGTSIKLSVDGQSLIVGSPAESSGATGVNNTSPGQGDSSLSNAGAAYTFALFGGVWTQTAYLKSFTSHANNFGYSAAITNGAAGVVVGASSEPSNDIGVDGTNNNTSAAGSGAAYTFK